MWTNPPCSITTPVHRLALCLLTGWAIGSEGCCTVTFTPVGSESQPFEAVTLSRNGEFLLGHTIAPDGQRSVSVWHAGTLHPVGDPGTLILGFTSTSIADDGTVVGWIGGIFHTDEQQVWRYDAPSDSYQLALNALPNPPIGTGRPEMISADASTIAGTVILDFGVGSTIVWHAPFDEAARGPRRTGSRSPKRPL